MTTSTPRVNPGLFTARPRRPPANGSAGTAAFTLPELIVSAGLSSLVLGGVLSTFLLLLRTGQNASAYAEMNGRLRIALERFHHDARLASDLRWNSEHSLTFILPAGTEREVSYFYAPPSRLHPSGRFVRQPADLAGETLVRDIATDFTFRRYALPDDGGSDKPASNDLETRLVEVSLRALRPGATNPTASQLAVSTRCLLRNKGSGS